MVGSREGELRMGMEQRLLPQTKPLCSSFRAQHLRLQSTYRQGTKAFRVNRSLVHKDILRAVFRDDKAKALLDVEPLDGSTLGGKENAQSVTSAIAGKSATLCKDALGECGQHDRVR